MDINNYYKQNLRRLIAAAEKAKIFEADPEERKRINEDIALMSADLAADIMASGFDFPESPEAFEDLLRDATEEVAKHENLVEVFDKTVEAAEQGLKVTQRIIGLLGKYGKFLA
jgi:phage shock protein A